MGGPTTANYVAGSNGSSRGRRATPPFKPIDGRPVVRPDPTKTTSPPTSAFTVDFFYKARYNPITPRQRSSSAKLHARTTASPSRCWCRVRSTAATTAERWPELEVAYSSFFVHLPAETARQPLKAAINIAGELHPYQRMSGHRHQLQPRDRSGRQHGGTGGSPRARSRRRQWREPGQRRSSIRIRLAGISNDSYNVIGLYEERPGSPPGQPISRGGPSSWSAMSTAVSACRSGSGRPASSMRRSTTS